MSIKTIYDYPELSGHQKLRVIRTDRDDGTKTFSQLSFNLDTGKWDRHAPPQPFPLFNSIAIHTNQDKPIIHAEGEKAAIEAGKYFPTHIHTTTAGGSNSAKKSDYSLGAGRDILITYDNDITGTEYLNKVGKFYLDAGAARVDVLVNPKDAPPCFDIADCGNVPTLPGMPKSIYDDPTKWDIIPFVHVENKKPKQVKPISQPKIAKLPKNSSNDERKAHRFECYVKAAIFHEQNQLSNATEGSRNKALNAAAFNLKKLANSDWAAPFICNSDIDLALRKTSGLPNNEVDATLKSVFKNTTTAEEPENKPIINNPFKPNITKTTNAQTKQPSEDTIADVVANLKVPVEMPIDFCIENGNLIVSKGYDKDGIQIFNVIYPGTFEPIGIYEDADNGDVFIDIKFTLATGRIKNAVVLSSELATRMSIIKSLTLKGAGISQGNADDCVEFIRLFLAVNGHILRQTQFTRKMGFYNDNIFVLPNKTIGGDIEYRGDLSSKECRDNNIYLNTLRTVFNWGDDAWVLILLIGFSLSSPFINKVGIVRNPVIQLFGESGYGKTTIIKYATTLWGKATALPFFMEGSQPSTIVGFSQMIAGLNGLPTFFDEINQAETQGPRMVKWLQAVMMYANATSRMRGSKSNEYMPEGGKNTSGVLFGAGEIAPDTNIAGVFNRVLCIDTTVHWPLGIEGKDADGRQSKEGSRRAKLLEKAIRDGHGVLGGQFVEYVLNKWDDFETDYIKTCDRLNRNFNEYTEPLALCLTSLLYLTEMSNINNKDILQTIEIKLDKLFTSNEHNESHPAVQALEKLHALLVACRPALDSNYFVNSSIPVYWIEDECFIIPNNSVIVKNQVGEIKGFYKKWIELGALICGKDGRSTQQKRPPYNKLINPRCLVIPIKYWEYPESNCTRCTQPNFETGTKKLANTKAVPTVPAVPSKTHSHIESDSNIESENTNTVIHHINKACLSAGTAGTVGTAINHAGLNCTQVNFEEGTVGTNKTNKTIITDKATLKHLMEKWPKNGSGYKPRNILDIQIGKSKVDILIKEEWIHMYDNDKYNVYFTEIKFIEIMKILGNS